MDGLILAIQFLTRLPIKKEIEFSIDNLKKAVVLFPLVGLIIGVFTVLPRLFLSNASVDILALISLFINIFITGGLHLDGLADCADGFLSGRSKEKVIEIMKDSRIGSFGVVALILVILSKYLLYKAVYYYPLFIIFSIINSRFSGLHLINNYDAPDYKGLSHLFHQARPGYKEYLLLSIYIIILCFLKPLAILPFFASIYISRTIANKSMKLLAYVSGDVMGACEEITEVCSLFLFWVMLSWK